MKGQLRKMIPQEQFGEVMLDFMSDKGNDLVEVELQDRAMGTVLYLHINGITVARVCGLGDGQFTITDRREG